MTNIVSSTVFLKPFSAPGQVFRLVTVVVMLSSLVACAVAPTKSSDSGTAGQQSAKSGMDAAADMYNSRNYPGAVREFDNIITDSGSSANSRRMAHLGKALVYLGNDSNWHSVDNAKLSLLSAGQVAPSGNEEFAVETDLLMDAISAVIGTESKYAVMVAKSSGAGAQAAEFRQEVEVLKAENEALLAEQKVLNETIEKLKELTLGN